MRAPSLSIMGEWIFALFLVSEYFKADPRLGFIQTRIDITLLLLGLSFSIFLYRMIRNPSSLRIPWSFLWQACLFLLLAALFVAGLVHTESNGYGLDKTMRFVFLTGWTFFGAALLIRDFMSLKRFSLALVAISAAMAIDAALKYGQYERLTAFGGDYISLGRACGLGLITIIAFFLPMECKRWFRLSLWILAALLLFSALGSGSRGPVISLMLSLLVFFMLNFRGSSSLKIDRFALKLGVMMLFAAIIFFILGGQNSSLFSRIQLAIGGTDPSAAGRLYYYRVALEQFAASPIWGLGPGQFSIGVTGEEIALYPHNIFLELGAESGLLGIIIFVTMIVIAFGNGLVHLYRKNGASRIASRYLLVVCCFFLLNAMVSYDINGNRILFAFFGLLAVVNRFHNKHWSCLFKLN